MQRGRERTQEYQRNTHSSYNQYNYDHESGQNRGTNTYAQEQAGNVPKPDISDRLSFLEKAIMSLLNTRSTEEQRQHITQVPAQTNYTQQQPLPGNYVSQAPLTTNPV